MSEATPLLAPGVVVAETWEIERQLGRGGMGEVWLAKNRRLAGKQVAIKVLHVDRELPQEALARFKREAEIAARLEHPNLVQVQDFNFLPSGQPYLVMEYLKGTSLALRARGRTFDLAQVAGIMRQVGAALQAAHQAGVVHRDLKPENIFLVPTAVGDQVKVLDFGISKLADSNTVKTTDSVLIGTPLYMSPEQALGQNSDVSAQSDVFSLGSICYELFTGTAPFVADNIAKVVFRIAYEKHAPLASVRPDLAPHALAAVEHALEKDRAKRTPDIETFVLELTGQALENVEEERSGLFAPGMVVTPSLAEGATRAPSSGPQARATPAPQAPVDPLGSARTVSGKKVIIALVVGATGLALLVGKVRTDNWAERAAYHAKMLDAGYTMRPDGTFLMDAGPATEPTALLALDAGAPDAEVAEAAEVAPEPPDAGAVAVEPPSKPKAVERMTVDEMKLLAEYAAFETQGAWDRLWDGRARLRGELHTAPARERGFGFLVEAACRRGDNTNLQAVVTQYKAVATPAQVRSARQRCVAVYANADVVDW